MPRYVYQFDDGVQLEVSHSIHQDALIEHEHPETGEVESVRRVISATPVMRFVGGGGYGRKSFHDRTNSERLKEIVGDRKLGVDIDRAPA